MIDLKCGETHRFLDMVTYGFSLFDYGYLLQGFWFLFFFAYFSWFLIVEGLGR